MFATILRRWRIVTPLALAVLAIAIVAGGILTPAAAHNVKFHFFGRALALQDASTILPDRACDTGFIDINGGSLDTGHCFSPPGPGTGTSLTGSLRLESLFAEATVKTGNTHHQGNVISTADLEGVQNAHQFTADAPGTTVGLSQNGLGIPNQNNCVQGTGPGAPAQTVVINGVPTLVVPACIPFCATAPNGFGGEPNPVGNNNNGCSDGIILSFGDTGFTDGSLTDALYWASTTKEVSQAECKGLNNRFQAHVSASPTWINPAVREDNTLRLLGPSGRPNETFPISGTNLFGFSNLSILVIFNEQKRFVDGGFGWISATAVHMIATDDDGTVQINFLLAHVFSGIHCAAHLPFEDPLQDQGSTAS